MNYVQVRLFCLMTFIGLAASGLRCMFPSFPRYPDYPDYGFPAFAPRPNFLPIFFVNGTIIISSSGVSSTTAATTTRTTVRSTTRSTTARSTTTRSTTRPPSTLRINARGGDETDSEFGIVDESVNERVDEIVGEAVDEYINEAENEAVNEEVYEAVDEAVNEAVNEAINERADEVEPEVVVETFDEAIDNKELINTNEEEFQPVEIPEDNNEEYPREKRQINYPLASPIPSVMPVTCGCYSPILCPINTDVTGLIDMRIVNGGGGVPTCTTGLQYCCPGGVPPPSFTCGTRFTPSVIYPLQQGQARYGDFPWMVAILTTDNQYIGGGVLIDTQNVLTTAHRIAQYPNGNGLKIRLGEWDTTGNYEQYPYRDFSITKLWLHELFNPSTLQNDIALVRLSGQVPTMQPIGVVPICMPTPGQIFEGQRCWVSGWGSDIFGTNGRYQNILKTVDVPIISSAACENTLKTSRLGTGYVLDTSSFICAGGEVNKDACTGDGGSGLVCETSPGRWVLAGLVSWGLGCATPGIPGAYVNVVNFLPWIQARQPLN